MAGLVRRYPAGAHNIAPPNSFPPLARPGTASRVHARLSKVLTALPSDRTRRRAPVPRHPEARQGPMISLRSASERDKVAFLFHLGHGHYTQFLNFQECMPENYQPRAAWVALHGEGSGDPLARIPLLPGSRRYARHQMWHARRGLAENPGCSTIFCAAEITALADLTPSYRCFLYTDLTPSLKRELAPWYDHQLRGSPIIRAIKESRRRRLYRSCHGIFTMSAWAARGFACDYGVPEEKLHVVLPGANLNLWKYTDRSVRPTRGPAPVRILMVGGQFRLKGGELLLRWAEETRLRNWEMDIVTWPSELPEWAGAALAHPRAGERVSGDLAPRLPGVRIHCGMQANTPELMNLYERADIFCLPTQADGSSIASLEAMASGLPVLVGAAGGIPELIEDGRTGCLLERGCFEDLACKLDRFIMDRDLRITMGRRARASCEDYFNVTRQIREIMQVIDAYPAAAALAA